MNEILNMETIYRQERQRWMKEEAPQRSMRDLLTGSVPYWIVLVALVLYGLSAPHTASVFDKLTPGWGWIAPIGVEFGLLYAAFRRRLDKAGNHPLPWTLWALEILLFLTAMLVNGAGSFTSVVAVTQLQDLSFAAIIEGFGHLPATTQAALVMALLSAFIIPIGALVAGDGLAALALERRTANDFREERWQEVESTVIYRAVFVRYLQQGVTERDARQRAFAEVRGYLGKGNLSGVRLLSAPSGQSGQATNGQNGHQANKQEGTVKGRVSTYLAENPDLAQLSVNQVLSALRSAGVQAGRTTVAEVLQERKQGL
ncbi:MAG: hypothetical protein K8L97_20395 [Anaerolineae bacterium]|nr:hypothetical protein [Anaerolineae bacterium]